ncbi:Lyzozyme M1 (1,4-beta-N-acetylmuramidase) [Companilactobacillus alimentarius DSM 20249]|nr:Lyzozyme M1 (1,4-beta-N-acetylmuramidase) [Companilactobacillus alimentarius DSM 20249]
MVVLFFCATNVQAARVDMVDVSNNNGAMTVSNFKDMHDNYGVKAMVTKISEGTSFKDTTAAGNIAAAKSAGLYVNGYHYARYSSVSGAKAEADYAAKLAQADGFSY